MKAVIISIFISIALIGTAFALSKNDTDAPNDDTSIENVSLENGVQIIDIEASGGYYPQKSTAQANVATSIRFTTKNIFDCSSAVRIPKLNISENLKRTGTTMIEIGPQPEGILRGSCGMGMYSFLIDFRS